MEPILLHAWSPKNGGWVQSVHRPRVDPLCGRADACMHGRVDAWTRQPPHFIYFFLLSRYITQTLQNCISPTIRIGREIRCLPYAGFLGRYLQCRHFKHDILRWTSSPSSWWTQLLPAVEMVLLVWARWVLGAWVSDGMIGRGGSA